MRTVNTLALAGVLALGGCATAATAPTVIDKPALAPAAPIHISDVTLSAKDGVWISDGDREFLLQKILAQLNGLKPSNAPPTATTDYVMHVELTRFDKGSTFGRLMFIGLGQIHIEGTIALVDDKGADHGRYKIVKTYAMGGLAGGMTSASDVEEGFAKSVAAIVAPTGLK